MDDVYQIQKLLYSYCWLIDSGDFDGVCRLLKDADIYYSGKLTYKKDPKGYMNTLKPIVRYEDGTPKTSHLCLNPVIEVSADGLSATARSYTVVVQGISGQMLPQVIWVDRKMDRLEKVDGQWRFKSRDFVTRAEGDTARHIDMSVFSRKKRSKA